MRKIGIFLGDTLLIEYPYRTECYMEALEDLTECIEETGVFHELKLFED